MIIDVFCHHVSKNVGRILSSKGTFGEGKEQPIPHGNDKPEYRLNIMEKYGVDMQALSQTTPVLVGLDRQEAVEVCRVSNDENYAFCKAYPHKFVNVCIISLLDMAQAMNELQRCINELDCRGVIVSSNQNGNGLDSPAYFPFYEKLVDNDLPLFIHGTHWECPPLMDMENAWRFLHVFGWDYDGTQALWRLIFGGVLDRYPALKLVTHHMGNYFPFFRRRIEVNFRKYLKDKLPRDISEYFGNIYGDTAVDGTPGAFACGYAFFGADRMMFGTDYPFGLEDGEDFIRENLACIKTMPIPEAEVEKILGGNAQRLLKIDPF